MRVEEVKTSFIADTQKYIRDIQKAQKVLNTFLNTNDMTKKEKAENRLQVAIQKRAQAQAKALTEELKLKRQVDGANSKLASSQNNVNKSISKSTSSSKMFAGELAHIARNAMTLYYSVKSLGKVLTTGIDFNRTKENARLAFTVMFRSADVATQKIKELQEYAVASPLSFKETISASKQLSAYGFGADELVPAMEMLGTVAKATGHSLDDISYVYGTLRTQGQAYSRDLMQFAMRGIPIYEELAEVMGVNQKEIKKLTEEGKVGFKEVEKAFKNMTKEGGKFGGLLDEYMKGFEGIASQLSDMVEVSLGKLTEPLFEALKKEIRSFIQVFEKGGLDKLFADIGKSIASLIPVLAEALKTILVLLPAIINFGKIFLTLFISNKLIGGITKAFLSLSAGIGSFARFSNVAIKPLMAFSKVQFAKGVGNSFAAIIKGIKGMGVAAKAFAMANPWLLALLAGTVAVSIVVNIIEKNIEKTREFIQKYGDTKQLIEFDVDLAKTRANVRRGLTAAGIVGAGMGAIGTAGALMPLMAAIPLISRLVAEKNVSKVDVDAVKEMASQYGISALELADILLHERMISREIHNIIRDEETRTKAAQKYKEILESNVQLQQQAYLNERLGYDLMSQRFALMKNADGTDRAPVSIIAGYTGMGNVSETPVYWTAGQEAGAEYTGGVREALKSREAELKKAYNDTISFADPSKGRQLFNADMMVDHYKTALEEVNTLLEEGTKIPLLYEQTTWDEELRKLKEELEAALEKSGSSKKGVEIKLDPWFDREKMASATKMVFDDLELQYDKDLATAKEKLEKKEIDYGQYIRAIWAIESKYLDDIIEANRNASLEVFELWQNGSTKFFENFKKGFVDAISKGGDILSAAKGLFGAKALEGSQVGSIISGAFGQRDEAIQKSKDDWIAAGNDPAKFNAGYAKQSFDMLGALKGGGITQFITSLAEMTLEVEEVTKVISPFATIADGAGKFLKPLLSVGFSGVASILEELGEVVGKTLLPLLHPILFELQFFSGILKITVIPVLQFFASIVSWLYDKILVPFGNSVLRIVNGIIDFINKIPGINIERLRYFETTTEMLVDSSESMVATMEYMVKKLNDLIDKEIATLGDLYDVGAISGAEYARQVDDANMRRLSLEENMVDINVAQLESIDEIYTWLVKNGAYADLEALLAAEKLEVELPEGFYIPEDTSTYTPQTDTPFLEEVTVQAGKQWEIANELADSWGDKAGIVGTAAGALVGGVADVAVAIGKGVASLAGKIGKGIMGLFGFADGTSNIPYDMVANVHKGEGIVPATFMDSIRAGELTLSGNSGTSSGSITNYYITVEGSVTSENNLADSLAEKIEQRRTRGYGRK